MNFINFVKVRMFFRMAILITERIKVGTMVGIREDIMKLIKEGFMEDIKEGFMKVDNLTSGDFV